MTDDTTTTLTLDLTLHCDRQRIWQCWQDKALLSKWFCPAPWAYHCETLDLTSGGCFAGTMRGPQDEVARMNGLFLEVVPYERIVFTDAFVRQWQPSDKAFMVADVRFIATDDGHTRYVATVRHWSAQDCAQHEHMGFHDGWAKAARQLEQLALSLSPHPV